MKVEVLPEVERTYAFGGEVHRVPETVNKANEGLHLFKCHAPLDEGCLYIAPHDSVLHKFQVNGANSASLEGDCEVQLKTTVFHDQSHAPGGTNDIQCSQPGCWQLVINDPAPAAKNANSYEYFERG